MATRGTRMTRVTRHKLVTTLAVGLSAASMAVPAVAAARTGPAGAIAGGAISTGAVTVTRDAAPAPAASGITLHRDGSKAAPFVADVSATAHAADSGQRVRLGRRDDRRGGRDRAHRRRRRRRPDGSQPPARGARGDRPRLSGHGAGQPSQRGRPRRPLCAAIARLEQPRCFDDPPRLPGACERAHVNVARGLPRTPECQSDESRAERSTSMQTDPRRVLIVAQLPTQDLALLDAVAKRAHASPSVFTLLVPAVAHGLHRIVDPEDQYCGDAEATLDAAIPVLSEAAGGSISGMIGGHDPFAAAWDALNAGAYDEVIVSGRSSRLSRWLRVDLPRKIAGLGIPVTTVNWSEERRRGPAGIRAAA